MEDKFNYEFTRNFNRFNISYQSSYPFTQRSKFHPDLKYDYFDEIDSKEKAYWLGILFADGNIGKGDRITFHQNLKNSELVYRFSEAISYNQNRIKVESNKILLRIGSQRLAAALKRLGCVPAKSKIILLPDLKTRELYLAFLLGYFDGDDTIKTSKITSGSMEFLEQIKKMFKIRNKIHARKGCYDLYLGADLFNEMLDNYQNSLNRKRIRLESSNERNTRLLIEREKIYKKAAKLGGLSNKKFNLNKNELENLLNQMSFLEIAEKLKVSKSTIHRYVKKFDIK